MEQATSYVYAPSLEDVIAVDDVESLVKKTALPTKDLVKVSKSMSAVLRHDKRGKTLRRDGWALIEKLSCTENDALRAVCDNNKDRFSVGRGSKTGKLYVR